MDRSRAFPTPEEVPQHRGETRAAPTRRGVPRSKARDHRGLKTRPGAPTGRRCALPLAQRPSVPGSVVPVDYCFSRSRLQSPRSGAGRHSGFRPVVAFTASVAIERLDYGNSCTLTSLIHIAAANTGAVKYRKTAGMDMPMPIIRPARVGLITAPALPKPADQPIPVLRTWAG